MHTLPVIATIFCLKYIITLGHCITLQADSCHDLEPLKDDLHKLSDTQSSYISVSLCINFKTYRFGFFKTKLQSTYVASVYIYPSTK